MIICLKKQSSAALIESAMGKGSLPKKSTTVEKKGKTLTLCSNLELQKGVMSSLMRMWMIENQAC
jgi:hypothetical protein